MKRPPRIEFLHDYRLAVCRPVGRLDADHADWILLYLIGLERDELEPFNRLVDFTQITDIVLSIDDIYKIAHGRRLDMAGRTPVRTAILARNPLAYGAGRIYEVLMEGSPIQVRVCQEAQPAAEWLRVPVPVVEAAPDS